ncbi:MAG: hypothetical protein LUB62_04985 [Prevotellaceae bacterium]|nr:hypothetical protein [Prevotellaceae bacterium]
MKTKGSKLVLDAKALSPSLGKGLGWGQTNGGDEVPGVAEYRLSLEFYVFVDGGDHIAYCPSLDISTSGDNFNEAVANFCECLRAHIDWCVERGTLLDDLASHGWRKRKTTLTPPSFSSMLKKKEVRSLLGGSTAYEKVVIPARVPLSV